MHAADGAAQESLGVRGVEDVPPRTNPRIRPRHQAQRLSGGYLGLEGFRSAPIPEFWVYWWKESYPRAAPLWGFAKLKSHQWNTAPASYLASVSADHRVEYFYGAAN